MKNAVVDVPSQTLAHLLFGPIKQSIDKGCWNAQKHPKGQKTSELS